MFREDEDGGGKERSGLRDDEDGGGKECSVLRDDRGKEGMLSV